MERECVAELAEDEAGEGAEVLEESESEETPLETRPWMIQRDLGSAVMEESWSESLWESVPDSDILPESGLTCPAS